MNELLKEELADLRHFADPFEEFTSSLAADGWTASFVRKGEEIALRRELNGVIRTLCGPRQRQYRSLKGLLVSEPFANLERLAGAQIHLTSKLVNPDTGELIEFLPNAGEIRLGKDALEPLTFDRVRSLLEKLEERLRIFVVDGVAGVGKSYLIERIVRERAEPTSYKSGKPLLLHVESRGKVLTSLNDRIAGTLSSLRASFFEEELKPLIRRGVMQLAIDGFDELSDSRGYDRAWGALRDFIRDLRGQGTCLLAGRDTMLDAQAVHNGLGHTVSDDSITFLRLLHPPSDKVKKWMSHRPDWHERTHELNLLERQIEGSEYLRRPFFISRIADLGPDRFRDAQGEPIVEIIDGIVRREGPKLTTESSDLEPQLASKLYGEVLSETARMMMDDETNDIDVDLLGLLVEEIFAGHGSRELVNALAQRAHALALLEESTDNPRMRSFPHETVRSYFFAQNIFDHFPEHGATTGLYRVPLNADDFRIFNRVARRRPDKEQSRLRKRLLETLRGAAGYDYLRSNIGGLLLSFAPLKDDDSESDPLVLAHFELRDAWLADLLGTQNVRLHDGIIHRLDVRGADLDSVRFFNTTVFELLADPYVRFGESTPEVHSLIVYEHFREHRWLGKPTDWMAERCPKSDHADQETDELWDLLYKFARISMRQYAIRADAELGDPAARKVLGSPLWPKLRTLLEEHERLDIVDKPASGPKSDWFHLVLGSEFLHPKGATMESTRKILKELNVRC